jgi:putative acetyltransferase
MGYNGLMPATILQERPDTPDAALLITELEDHLAARYPRESRHGFSVERLLTEGVAFFVVRQDGAPAACGGVKLFPEYGELKRMYVRPAYRGLGLGKLVLERLERHALEHGVTVLRLETGVHQLEAIRLYERVGFRPIPPFGDYRPDPLSLCFEKRVGEATEG